MDAFVSFPHPILADWFLTITKVRLADGESILYVGEISYKDKPLGRITSAGSKANADLVSQFERWVSDYVVSTANLNRPVVDGDPRMGEALTG